MFPVPDASLEHAVILDKYDFQLSVDAAVVIDNLCNGVDQLDRLLCPQIACSRLRTEDKCSRIEAHLRMLFDLVVQVHDMQDVEELSLILVETFYLHVENGARVNIDAVVFLDIFRQAYFVLVLDLHELTPCVLIVYIWL